MTLPLLALTWVGAFVMGCAFQWYALQQWRAGYSAGLKDFRLEMERRFELVHEERDASQAN